MQKKLTRSHNSQLKVLDSLRVIIVEKNIINNHLSSAFGRVHPRLRMFPPLLSLLAPTHPFTHLPHFAALLLAIIPRPGPLLSFATPFSRPIIFSLPEHTRPYHQNTRSVPLSRFLYHTPWQSLGSHPIYGARSASGAVVGATVTVARGTGAFSRHRVQPASTTSRFTLRRRVVGWTTGIVTWRLMVRTTSRSSASLRIVQLLAEPPKYARIA